MIMNVFEKVDSMFKSFVKVIECFPAAAVFHKEELLSAPEMIVYYFEMKMYFVINLFFVKDFFNVCICMKLKN